MKHDHHASNAPTTSPPPKETTWSDRRDMVKEIGQAVKEVRVMLMWIAAIVLLGGLIAKKIDLIQLQTLKSWFGLGG